MQFIVSSNISKQIDTLFLLEIKTMRYAH